jgi:hypothetical protein
MRFETILPGTMVSTRPQPVQGLTSAQKHPALDGKCTTGMAQQGATRDAADAFYENRVKAGIAGADANNMLYYFDSSRE